MRRVILGVMLAATAGLNAALPARSGPADFDIKGVWAAESKGCQDAQSFIEFDGRDMLGYGTGSAKARVAGDYSAVVNGERIVVSVTDLKSREPDQLSFLIEGKDAIRLDNSFVARTGTGGDTELMKLTRCATST